VSRWIKFWLICGIITEPPEEAAKITWETLFDTPCELTDPIMNFLSRSTMSQTRLNNALHQSYLNFKIKIGHSSLSSSQDFHYRIKKTFCPGDQSWDQLLDLAGEQEANLNRNSDEVHKVFAASRRRCGCNHQKAYKISFYTRKACASLLHIMQNDRDQPSEHIHNRLRICKLSTHDCRLKKPN